jgi:A/G-specific adenine glycosylase
MLQQTRVAAVLPYYERFLEAFPDVGTLAAAGEEELLEVWSGLGYYLRARNLLRAAREIARRGRFPESYESWRQLPGVGPYTAAAVASIALGAPYATVDGNVLRVLSRVSAETADIGSASTRARLEEAAKRLLDRKRPGMFNQAMMELGATVCLPKQPDCGVCPVAEFCAARRAGLEGVLPLKLKRGVPVTVAKTLLLVRRNNGRFLAKQRDAGSRQLAGFWELPEAGDVPAARHSGVIGKFRHAITNTEYRVTVVGAAVARIPPGFQWVAEDDRGLPLATMTRKALLLAGLRREPRSPRSVSRGNRRTQGFPYPCGGEGNSISDLPGGN